MPLPNFIGIGAQRAATTWVYACLREHPEVFVTDEKELHYFDECYDKGLDWYESHFPHLNGKRAIGEITPNYLDCEAAIPRMADVLPHAKLFVILREPVQRTYSAYKLLHETFQGMTFRQACERAPALVKASLYAEQLDRVFTYYDKHRVKVLLYDDVEARPSETLAELFRFLDVNDSFRPSSTGKVFNHIVFPGGQRVARNLGLGWFISIVKKTPLGDWIKKRIASRGHSGKAAKEDEYFPHLREYFRSDILRLQTMVGRDLRGWL
jgi:hypothetical protein